MCAIIALIILGLPLLEIYVLIQIGGEIGALTTIGVLLGVALIGAFLSRRAGMATLRELAESAAKGRSMAPVMAEGALLALAGILFVIPGFVTDVAGLALLVPPLRRRLARKLVLRAAGSGRVTQSTTVIIDTTGVERPDRPAGLPARASDELDEDDDEDDGDEGEEASDPRADDDRER